jgi:Transposase IS116/IS110/IS902 family
MTDRETATSVTRLTRDLAVAASTLSDEEARYLVDAYYLMQENRKATANQARSMEAEPHSVIAWLNEQDQILEGQIKRALDKYTDARDIGQWMKSIHGIGPVIAAGLLAHIDITKAPTVGHIWRFAGLDPTVTWNKGQKRPWNAGLKTLCWKIGQSFMKFSGDEACEYGHVYRDRKAYEVARNDSGGNAARAAELLPKFKPSTEAHKHLKGGKLPPAQIDARARRYAVKLFLAHLHGVWFWQANGTLPPRPYIIEHGGHAHVIHPPNMPDDMRAALQRRAA